MRVNIRIKLFLIILGILAVTSVTFFALVSTVMESLMIKEYRQILIDKYVDVRDDYREGINLSNFLRQKEKGLRGFITVFDGSETVLDSTSPEVSRSKILPPAARTAFRAGLEGDVSGWKTYRALAPGLNEDIIGLVGKCGNGAYVLVEKSLAPTREAIRFSAKAILLTIGIVLFLGIFSAYFLAKIFTNPIFQIAKKAKALAALDFTGPLKVKSRDELGDLAETINLITDELRDSMNGLRRANERLEDDKARLNELNALLERQSITDSLTELANRRRISQVLEDEAYKSRVRGRTFSIILLDIDHFKEVNDTYGHQVGDSVLVEFARLLKENARRIDTVGRWGGEEFLLILPDTNLEGARAMAENLRKKVEAFLFTGAGNKTASFGVGECGKDADLREIIGKVDKALYAAKERGRNRVETVAGSI